MNEILAFTAKRIKPCPSTLLITPTQTILRTVRSELKEIGQELTQLQLIADSIPLYTSEKFSVLGPVIGMNAVNLALQPLLVERINEVYLISVAGSNNTNFSIGQILQGASFSKENGESYHCNSKFKEFQSADILSVNDPYSENGNFDAYDLVDMEAAEIAKLCFKYGKKFCSLFCISDAWQSKEKKWASGFSTKELNLSLKQASRFILEIIKT